MRVKTYGRRNRLRPAADAFLEASPAPVEERIPLAESSHNKGFSFTSRAHRIETPSLHIYDHSAKIDLDENGNRATSRPTTPKPVAHKTAPASLETSSSSKRTSPRKKRVVPSDLGIKSPSDDISAAFVDLSLHSIRDPQHQRTPRPRIEACRLRERPAAITAQTKAYLQSLIDCKNVSKCIEDFQSWMNERDGLLSVLKIGEGSFGEVYRAQGGEDAVILKLMPLNAQKGKGSRSFTSVNAAKNEIRLLGRMSKVPGFVEFRGACVLQGKMPWQLVKQWNDYRHSGRTVESKNPSKRDSYPSTQLWLLIEMSDAGESLERGRYAPPGSLELNSSKSKDPYLPVRYTWDIFWQIGKALAKGEVFAMYEHRDLHLGNICIKDKIQDLRPEHQRPAICLDGEAICSEETVFGIDDSGIEVTLIDYSLSRASIGPDNTLAYDFKNDKALLRGKGDLQYDMYRYMADVVGPRSSSDFVPQTNVMWLYYVLKLLLEATQASRDTVENDMLIILCEMRDQLHPDRRSEWEWESAGDLLHMGIEEGWFLPTHVTDM